MLIPSPFWYASLKILWLFFPLGFPAFLGFSHLQPSSWTKSQPRFAPRKVAALGVGIPKPYSHHWEDIALVPATCRSLWIHVEPTEAKVPQGWSPTFNHHSQVKCWLSLRLIPRFYRFKWKTLPTNQIILWLRLQKSKPSHTFFAWNIHCCLPYLELILDHLVTCVFFRLYLKKQIWTHQVQWKQNQLLRSRVPVGKGCISLLLWGVRFVFPGAESPSFAPLIFVHSVWQGQCGSCADILQGSWHLGVFKTTIQMWHFGTVND